VSGDFNGDGQVDLAVVNAVGDDISVMIGNGDGTFTNVPFPAVTTASTLVTCDLDGDDILVLISGSDSVGSDEVSVLFGNGSQGKGDGTFTSPLVHPIGDVGVKALTCRDVNFDGLPDIVVGTDGCSDVAIALAGVDRADQRRGDAGQARVHAGSAEGVGEAAAGPLTRKNRRDKPPSHLFFRPLPNCRERVGSGGRTAPSV
jgi:hypothetical protein